MWYKGCFHIHTNNSDGELSPADVYCCYKDKGYDFIAITDHNCFTDLENSDDSDLLVIENSIEIGYPASPLHILGIGMEKKNYKDKKDFQEIIDIIIDNKGIAVISHPNYLWVSASFNDLVRLKRYHGIEIFNPFIKEHVGSQFALEKWDYLLSLGYKVWGFAGEDLHWIKEDLVYRGWMMVNARRFVKEDIMESIIGGDFYCSSGVVLDECKVYKNKFRVSSKNGEEIVFIGDNGKIIRSIDGKTGELEIDKKYRYLRCEVRSQEGIAYSQPIFMDSL
jgi:hypothetical protein